MNGNKLNPFELFHIPYIITVIIRFRPYEWQLVQMWDQASAETACIHDWIFINEEVMARQITHAILVWSNHKSTDFKVTPEHFCRATIAYSFSSHYTPEDKRENYGVACNANTNKTVKWIAWTGINFSCVGIFHWSFTFRCRRFLSLIAKETNSSFSRAQNQNRKCNWSVKIYKIKLGSGQ